MACTWTFASGNRRFVLFPPNQRQCSLRRCPGGDPRRHLTDEARAVPGRLWCSYCGKNHAGGKCTVERKGECFGCGSEEHASGRADDEGAEDLGC
jgi:hypothetical protein